VGESREVVESWRVRIGLVGAWLCNLGWVSWRRRARLSNRGATREMYWLKESGLTLGMLVRVTGGMSRVEGGR
jgi:hypothetical protein